MTIPEFIRRCDAYCAATGVSRVWLSKRLFSDTFRLEHLEAGSSDVGVRRLERAAADLRRLAAEVPALCDEPGSHDAAAPAVEDVATLAVMPGCGAENPAVNISRTGRPS